MREVTLQQQQQDVSENGKIRRRRSQTVSGGGGIESSSQSKLATDGYLHDDEGSSSIRNGKPKKGHRHKGGSGRRPSIFGRVENRLTESNIEDSGNVRDYEDSGSESSHDSSSSLSDVNSDMDDHRAPLGMDTMLKFEDKLKIISRKLNTQREQVRAHMTIERSHRKRSRPTFRMPTFAVLSPTARLAPVRRSSVSAGGSAQRDSPSSGGTSPRINANGSDSVLSSSDDASRRQGILDLSSLIKADSENRTAAGNSTVGGPEAQDVLEDEPALSLTDVVEWTPSETRFRSKLAAHAEALDALQEQLDSIVRSLPPDDHHDFFEQHMMDIEDFSDAMAWTFSTDAGSLADFSTEEKAWEETFDTSIAELLQYAHDLEESMKRTDALTSMLEEEAKQCEKAAQENTIQSVALRTVRNVCDVPAVQRRHSPFGIPRYVSRYSRWFQPFEAMVYHLVPWLGALWF